MNCIACTVLFRSNVYHPDQILDPMLNRFSDHYIIIASKMWWNESGWKLRRQSQIQFTISTLDWDAVNALDYTSSLFIGINKCCQENIPKILIFDFIYFEVAASQWADLTLCYKI